MAEQQSPMDWNDFEKQMLKQFPFLPKNFTRMDFSQNANWIGDLVKKNIDRFINQNFMSNATNPSFFQLLSYDLLETNNSIIVRLHLPNKMPPHNVKMSVSRRKVRLDLPTGKRQEIQLEKPVDPKRSRANFKDGVMEIRMPKVKEPSRYHSIYL
jgi:HSP20 family molecular chaperone IbpA